MIKLFLIFALMFELAFGKIEVYFSPSKECRDAIIREVRAVNQNLKIAIFDFTNKDIAKEVKEAINRGVIVKIITDRSKLESRDSQLINLQQSGAKVKVNKKARLEHNKFAIFDEKKVLTGSANWTYSAFAKNSENCILFDDVEAVEKYNLKFEEIFVANI